MSHIFSVHLPIDGHLGFLFIMAIVNNAAVNTGVHISGQNSVLISLGCIARNGTSRLYGRLIFNFLRTLHIFNTFPLHIFLFTTSLPALVVSCLLNDSRSNSTR